MSNNKKKTKKGFTLVEMLVVVIIIGVLTAVALPSYMKSVEKTRTAQAISTLGQIAKAQHVYNAKHGRYSSMFLPLNLDLKDKKGKPVNENGFADSYFAYNLDYNIANAKRDYKGGTYVIYVDYATGQLYCKPENHEVCQMIGLKEMPKNAPVEGSCEVISTGSYDGACFKESAYNGVACNKEGVSCLEFKDGIPVGKWELGDGKCDLQGGSDICSNGRCYRCQEGQIEECKPNAEGNGCLVPKPMVCDGATCAFFDKDGNKIGSCDISDTKCLAKFNASGLICNPKDGKCYTYENGKIIDECKANKEGTACVKITVECQAGGVGCIIYEDGNKIDVCDPNQPECYEGYGVSGLVCSPKDGKCYTYENGKIVAECKANKEGTDCEKEEPSAPGITYNCVGSNCTIYEDGKEVGTCYNWDTSCLSEHKINGIVCQSKTPYCLTFKDGIVVSMCNESIPGCKEGTLDREHPENGTACYKEEETCYIYKDGQFVDYCMKNPLGTDCAAAGEELVCYKDKGICIDYNADGKIIGDCQINTAGTGCAQGDDGMKDGILCDKEVCYIYKDGKVVDTCKANDTGTGCKGEEPECKPDDWSCICAGDTSCYADNGVSGFFCFPKDGVCRTFEKGKEVDKCEINDAGTGCKEEKPAWKCDGWECTEYLGDKPTGNTCYHNGNGGCIIGKGEEIVCPKGKKICVIYVDGEYQSECTVNDTGTGCKEEEAPVWKCDGWECTEYLGDKPTGNTCYHNGYGDCIKGKGEEIICMKGTCQIYYDGKYKDSCKANDAGTGCKEETPKDGFQCDINGCSIFEKGEKVDYCEAAAADCMGKYGVSAFVCDKKYCYTYKDGSLTGKCKVNDTGDGCAKKE